MSQSLQDFLPKFRREHLTNNVFSFFIKVIPQSSVLLQTLVSNGVSSSLAVCIEKEQLFIFYDKMLGRREVD